MNIFDFDIVLFPINVKQEHWILVSVDFRAKKISLFDSLYDHSDDSEYLKNIFKFLKEQQRFEIDERYDLDNFELSAMKDILKQTNFHDCGFLICYYAKSLCNSKEINFKSTDIPFLRRRMIYEFYRNKLKYP